MLIPTEAVLVFLRSVELLLTFNCINSKITLGGVCSGTKCALGEVSEICIV